MHNKTLKELSTLLHSKQVSSTELTQHYLDRIAASAHNAFLQVDAELSLAQAKQADARFADGSAGPLTGIPIAHKDIFVTKGWRSTAASKMLGNYVSPFDATVVEKFADAGMVTLGKLNCDEFAMGSSNENSAFGAVKNPWDALAVPGGSSGGSAAAIAARLAPAATGTDTGGSIRQPAAVCGVVGTKPTYGGNSRYGVVAFASSLDTPGPLARTVLDAALLHEAISGHDPCDSTSIDAPVPPVVAAAREADVSGMRIGVVSELS
ncbi:MAG TPA: amidase family protein, partial [Telluria sp.]